MTLPAVTCTHCGRHFSRKSSLKQHIRDAHLKPHNKRKPKPLSAAEPDIFDYKPAICSRCGQDLGGRVPVDATEVICFACDNPEARS